MVTSWAAWKPFPDARNGGHIEAPIGPGVYEVRHTETGVLVAFGSSRSVANDLAKLIPKPVSGLLALFGVQDRIPFKIEELEYRTCSAATAAEARIVAERLRGRREVFWRTRLAAGPA